MTDLVSPEEIEQIVGVPRAPAAHAARVVSEDQTVYILHSGRCRDSGIDLRECDFSLALDRGLPEEEWQGKEDLPVWVVIKEGRLVPDRGHILTLTRSSDWAEDEPYFDHQIECLVPERCGGWQECGETHEVDGLNAADGPWEGDDGAPWFEQEEFVFHGVEHEWRYGYGWTVPFEGCVVAANDSVYENAHEIGCGHGPGRYLVDDDWDDTCCILHLIAPIPGREAS